MPLIFWGENMKYSELSINEVKEYLRIDDDSEDNTLNIILLASKSFVKGYTGLSLDQLDQYDDLSIVILVLCAEMYDNRQFTVDKANISPVILIILNLYSINLL
ncbi:phage gp6-like head-tail connector protein [Clostridium saccharoperbutylacetonicum]|nr:phage gp6-like head-tail connector protein [Clostridium saccharoperbutylacetonicum]